MMEIHPCLQNTPQSLSALQSDALAVFGAAVRSANPYTSTCTALRKLSLPRCRFVVSIGKAAVPMMQAAYDTLGTENITEAVLVTKYGHTGTFRAARCTCFEAAHPVSDDNSEKAAFYVLQKTADLTAEDTCLVLLSGGGSALFEASLIDKKEQQEITDILLKSGADIYELNCVRKRLSAVKGGRLAANMHPAKVYTLALSDVPGSRPDVIASGPTQPDPVADAEFLNTVRRYIPDKAALLSDLPPRPVFAAQPHFDIVGDVGMLCRAAAEEAEKRGYEVRHLSADLTGDAQENVRSILCDILRRKPHEKEKTAYIYGGETTVTVKGNGKGGRSQQAALCAALALQQQDGIVFLAGGSDGTDGPTDAAGGVVDGTTAAVMAENGFDAASCLADNNAYPALRAGNALLMTGPTGTNVNDLFLILTED